jgi:flagellar biosynthetic protein FliQ
MAPQDAVDLARDAIMLMLVVSAPVLITGLAVGLLVGLFQALTQIQEQTITFVPKLVAMAVALSLSLPWLLNHLVRYSHDLIVNIPRHL